jgi:hypothetical protein
MRYVWVGVIAVSGAPVVYVGMLLNPFCVLLFGIEWWRERVVRLHPYRWWILFSILVCAFSVAVYTIKYG